MSKLPLKENIGSLTGDIYLRLPSAARPASAGYAYNASISLDVTQDPFYGVVDGVRTKLGTRVTEKGGTVSVTFQELRADHVAAALMASSAALTQASATGVEVNASDVLPGELIDLGALDVTAVVVTDGTAPLVSGTDYTLNAKAGTILMRTAQETVEVTFNKPAISESAGRIVSKILGSATGLRCELIIIGRNPDGVRYKVTGLHVALKPSGEFTLAGDGSSLTEITLDGDIEINEADPEAPFGYIEQLL